MERKRITIAILALGGQGGGVLADWIATLARANGYWVQATSVPGVAQRTGATVYYVELFPEEDRQGPPVLALMPVPGDVDIVLASELMEVGRAIVRGFVSEDRTTLIGSTHRIYTIVEKSAMGNGLAKSEPVLEAAERRAKHYIGFDMEEAATRSGSLISSVMFGALAASGALPFLRDGFEGTIRTGAIAVDANLRGFEAGWEAGRRVQPPPAAAPPGVTQPTSPAGRALLGRIERSMPSAAYSLAVEGCRRLMDFQDEAYAALYLDRLQSLASYGHDALAADAARYLALWMSYDDTIRVADLKTRGSRLERVRGEVKADDHQILHVTEYMHPRFREVCETLPAGLGGALLASRFFSRRFEPLFRKGRHVRTTGLFWFLAMRLLAGMRRWRRGTFRYRLEQDRIETWLRRVNEAAVRDPDVALELVRCQRLIKGYGDTHERGMSNFDAIMNAHPRLSGRGDEAAVLRDLREKALADEAGAALKAAISALSDHPDRVTSIARETAAVA